jgi:Cytochrome c oxidase subunit IV
VKLEGYIFGLGVVVFVPLAALYWFLSHDPVGTTALALSGALAFLIAFYVLYTSKRVYPRPEDRPDAEVDEADPEYGFFSPHSWWPLGLALAAFLLVLGLIFAVWLIVFGVFLLIVTLVGWLFEYYRGAFAH